MAKLERRSTKKAKSNNQANREPLVPYNNRQKEYIKSIKDEPLVICTGVWGSSKTFIPTVIACDMLLSEDIDKIIIARPAEGKGKSIGFLKGDGNQKLEPWCAPVLETIRKRIGEGHTEAFINNGKIELLALEHVKGRSWDDTFIIVDEAEDMDKEVAKSLVGRHGVRSKTVVTGDVRQKDLKGYSGIEYLLDVAGHFGMDVPHIDFDDWEEHCVRSEVSKQWGMAFESYEKRGEE